MANPESKHLALLQICCRICGSQNKSNLYPLIPFNFFIKTELEIDLSCDNMSVHPSRMCSKCKDKLTRMMENGVTEQLEFAHFSEHTPKGCRVCNPLISNSAPGSSSDQFASCSVNESGSMDSELTGISEVCAVPSRAPLGKDITSEGSERHLPSKSFGVEDCAAKLIPSHETKETNSSKLPTLRAAKVAVHTNSSKCLVPKNQQEDSEAVGIIPSTISGSEHLSNSAILSPGKCQNMNDRSGDKDPPALECSSDAANTQSCLANEPSSSPGTHTQSASQGKPGLTQPQRTKRLILKCPQPERGSNPIKFLSQNQGKNSVSGEAFLEQYVKQKSSEFTEEQKASNSARSVSVENSESNKQMDTPTRLKTSEFTKEQKAANSAGSMSVENSESNKKMNTSQRFITLKLKNNIRNKRLQRKAWSFHEYDRKKLKKAECTREESLIATVCEKWSKEDKQSSVTNKLHLFKLQHRVDHKSNRFLVANPITPESQDVDKQSSTKEMEDLLSSSGLFIMRDCSIPEMPVLKIAQSDKQGQTSQEPSTSFTTMEGLSRTSQNTSKMSSGSDLSTMNLVFSGQSVFGSSALNTKTQGILPGQSSLVFSGQSVVGSSALNTKTQGILPGQSSLASSAMKSKTQGMSIGPSTRWSKTGEDSPKTTLVSNSPLPQTILLDIDRNNPQKEIDTAESYHPSCFVASEAAKIMSCSLCHLVPRLPLLTPCGHIFCTMCSKSWFGKSGSCLKCQTKVSAEDIKQLSSVNGKAFKTMKLKCSNWERGCKFTCDLASGEIHKHESMCKPFASRKTKSSFLKMTPSSTSASGSPLPRNILPKGVLNNTHSLMHAAISFHSSRFVASKLAEIMSCSYCHLVPRVSCQTTCGHIFCTMCAKSWFGKSEFCFKCDTKVSAEDIQQLSGVAGEALRVMELRCRNWEKGCNFTCDLGSIEIHNHESLCKPSRARNLVIKCPHAKSSGDNPEACNCMGKMRPFFETLASFCRNSNEQSTDVLFSALEHELWNQKIYSMAKTMASMKQTRARQTKQNKQRRLCSKLKKVSDKSPVENCLDKSEASSSKEHGQSSGKAKIQLVLTNRHSTDLSHSTADVQSVEDADSCPKGEKSSGKNATKQRKASKKRERKSKQPGAQPSNGNAKGKSDQSSEKVVSPKPKSKRKSLNQDPNGSSNEKQSELKTTGTSAEANAKCAADDESKANSEHAGEGESKQRSNNMSSINWTANFFVNRNSSKKLNKPGIASTTPGIKTQSKKDGAAGANSKVSEIQSRNDSAAGVNSKEVSKKQSKKDGAASGNLKVPVVSKKQSEKEKEKVKTVSVNNWSANFFANRNSSKKPNKPGFASTTPGIKTQSKKDGAAGANSKVSEKQSRNDSAAGVNSKEVSKKQSKKDGAASGNSKVPVVSQKQSEKEKEKVKTVSVNNWSANFFANRNSSKKPNKPGFASTTPGIKTQSEKDGAAGANSKVSEKQSRNDSAACVNSKEVSKKQSKKDGAASGNSKVPAVSKKQSEKEKEKVNPVYANNWTASFFDNRNSSKNSKEGVKFKVVRKKRPYTEPSVDVGSGKKPKVSSSTELSQLEKRSDTSQANVVELLELTEDVIIDVIY